MQQQSTSTPKWDREKQQLIQKIIDCKAENQRNTLDLKKMSSTYDAAMSEKLKVEQLHSEKMDTITSQLNALQTELTALKIQCLKKDSEYKSVIHENQVLKARINQLQTNQQHTASTSEAVHKTSNNESDVYEIERIMDHKKKKNGLYFRIRWENYSEKDDTWEHESNVMCTLCKYMRKMNMN